MCDIAVRSNGPRRPFGDRVPLLTLPYQEIGEGPGGVFGEMPLFRRDPSLPELPQLRPVPGAAACPGLLAGQLHPQQPCKVRPQGSAARADPLQKDHRRGRQGAGRSEAAGVPVVDGVVRGLAVAERGDHLAQQPPGPVEQFVVAGDVVEAQHRRAAEGVGQMSGERGLSGAGVPVDADQTDRTAGRGQPAEPGGEVVDDGSWGRTKGGRRSGRVRRGQSSDGPPSGGGTTGPQVMPVDETNIRGRGMGRSAGRSMPPHP